MNGMHKAAATCMSTNWQTRDVRTWKVWKALLVALAHEATNPAKGDQAEHTGLGFWTHLIAI